MHKKNVGKIDKTLRITLGVALIFGALAGYGTWMWLGLIPLITGLFGTCPAYRLFGLKTCPMSRK